MICRTLKFAYTVHVQKFGQCVFFYIHKSCSGRREVRTCHMICDYINYILKISQKSQEVKDTVVQKSCISTCGNWLEF